MSLAAVLTVGWGDALDDEFSATRLHGAAHGDDDYTESIRAALAGSPGGPVTILGLEQLFRRRTDGFGDVQRFVGVLSALVMAEPGGLDVRCRIDAFAYSFLKGAKSMDLLLPEAQEPASPFRDELPRLRAGITALENFERDGRPLSANLGFTEGEYLALRSIVVRRSARDERRTLATLLVNGPSTMDEVSDDLGLSGSLGQRTVAAFTPAGILEARPGGRWAIATPSLSLVLFCLREGMGLDYLDALA